MWQRTQCGPDGLGPGDSGLWGSGCTLPSLPFWETVNTLQRHTCPLGRLSAGVGETLVPRTQCPAPPGTPAAGLGEEHPLPVMEPHGWVGRTHGFIMQRSLQKHDSVTVKGRQAGFHTRATAQPLYSCLGKPGVDAVEPVFPSKVYLKSFLELKNGIATI